GLRERERLRRATAEMFRGADALLLPSMPCAAPPIATLKARVNGKEYDGAWIHRPFLSSHNLTGYPALSVPMGFDADGLPLSLQIVGPQWSEARVLAMPHACEETRRETRRRRPPLYSRRHLQGGNDAAMARGVSVVRGDHGAGGRLGVRPDDHVVGAQQPAPQQLLEGAGGRLEQDA